MRERAFREYLNRRYPNKTTVSTRLSDLRAAERRLGSDFDEAIGDGERSLPDGLEPWERGAVKRYREFLQENPVDEEDGGDIDDGTPPERDRFSLEADLQRALRDNLSQLAPDLTLADNGSERGVSIGRIDVLARGSDGAWWVIELKAGKADDRAIGQLAAYMGALAEEESGDIRGLLVAHDFTDKALFAARAIPTIELKSYGFSLTFEDRD